MIHRVQVFRLGDGICFLKSKESETVASMKNTLFVANVKFCNVLYTI